jgi:hypothetical protein
VSSPAKAGDPVSTALSTDPGYWIPAFAGMTTMPVSRIATISRFEYQIANAPPAGCLETPGARLSLFSVSPNEGMERRSTPRPSHSHPPIPRSTSLQGVSIFSPRPSVCPGLASRRLSAGNARPARPVTPLSRQLDFASACLETVKVFKKCAGSDTRQGELP